MINIIYESDANSRRFVEAQMKRHVDYLDLQFQTLLRHISSWKNWCWIVASIEVRRFFDSSVKYDWKFILRNIRFRTKSDEFQTQNSLQDFVKYLKLFGSIWLFINSSSIYAFCHHEVTFFMTINIQLHCLVLVIRVSAQVVIRTNR